MSPLAAQCSSSRATVAVSAQGRSRSSRPASTACRIFAAAITTNLSLGDVLIADFAEASWRRLVCEGDTPDTSPDGALRRDMGLRLAVWLADVSAEAAVTLPEMPSSAVPPTTNRAELPVGVRSIRRATRS